jgi:hypothetical protein
MLRWGTADEEGLQIASATESSSKSRMRLPCMHARPARPPATSSQVLRRKSKNLRVASMLLQACSSIKARISD